MAESRLEKRVKIVCVVLEVVWGEAQEAFQDVEASEEGIDVGVFKELPHVNLEIRPGVILGGDD